MVILRELSDLVAKDTVAVADVAIEEEKSDLLQALAEFTAVPSSVLLLLRSYNVAKRSVCAKSTPKRGIVSTCSRA
jgi:hypothetical protein